MVWVPVAFAGPVANASRHTMATVAGNAKARTLRWLDLAVISLYPPPYRGRQITDLRLHAAVSSLRNDCTILVELDERITQLQYLLQLSWRTSEKPQKAKFAEFLFHALR